MKHRQAARVFGMGSALALLVLACSSKPPPTPQTPPAPEAPDAATTKVEDSAPPPPSAPVQTAADHHRDFMGGCAKKAVNSPDYCECAWDEFRKVFTDDEMNATDLSGPKLDKVKVQVAGACASKIPEGPVKDDFSNQCVGKSPELKPYCDCRWTELRKRFSVAELVDEATVHSDRFTSAREPVAKICDPKIPESVSRDGFMKGCAKDPSSEKFCGCAWKELRKSASAAQIGAGTIDQKTMFAKVDKGCGKLRPK